MRPTYVIRLLWKMPQLARAGGGLQLLKPERYDRHGSNSRVFFLATGDAKWSF
jgi:hypothetical protein